MLSQVWRLDQLRASLEARFWRVAIDVARPEDGLVVTAVQRPNVAAGHILGVELPLPSGSGAPIVDCYVRGADLVATYAMQALATRVQVYWRCVSDDSAVFDLQVSVQTDVLDAHPRLSARSEVSARQVEDLVGPGAPALARVIVGDAAPLRLPPGADGACLVFRLHSDGQDRADLAYIEMVHPADFSLCRLSRRGDNTVVEHELFAEKSLEKGVIMRSRVRGLLLRRAEGLEWIAKQAYERFVAAPLPLTT